MGNAAADVPIRESLTENQMHTWIFTPMLDGEYTFSLSSEDADKRYDPFLVLRDAAGTILAQDDDSGGDFNALVEGLSLPGGQAVTVEVHSFAEQSSGDYLFVVVTDRVEEPPIIAGGPLVLGQDLSSTLEFPSQQAEYSLDVAEAGLFNISVDGLKLPIIDIFDENDALVARGTASIKDQMLEAGTYRVLVYDRLNRTGDFTISTEEAQ
jgi:hypothetical protein